MLLANDLIMSGNLIWLLRHLKHQNLSNGDDFIHSSRIICLVPCLATKEALVLLVNDRIMSRRSIQSFRHLECRNPLIISDSIASRSGCKICDTQTEHGRNNAGIILDYITSL